MIKKGLLFVICGPSGVGKGTICKKFFEKNNSDDIMLSVSATTREAREGEIEGKNYFFKEKEVFEKMIKNDEFLEFAQVYGNYYGTPKAAIKENLEKGLNVILEIDIQGALQVKEKFEEGVFIFILPPSLEELKDRIVNRGTETPESLKTRFSSASSEIEKISFFDYFVFNIDLEKAVRELQSIIVAEQNKVNRYKKQILEKFKEEL